VVGGVKPNADKGGVGVQWKWTFTLQMEASDIKEWSSAAHSSPHQQQGKSERRNWHQLYHGSSMQSWAISAETVDEWDEISFPYYDTALLSHLPMDGARHS